MRPTIFFLITILSLNLGISQIPNGYYDDANGLSGTDLKNALYNIIKNHNEFSYSSTSTDVWDILKVTDQDPANSDNVILLYTGWSVDAAQEYNDGNGWTREHVWSKKHGDFGTTQGAGTDVHHLRPADVSVNSAKSNRWFDNCNIPYYDDGGTIPTGCNTSYSKWVWEPRDEVKGDVARMIFYMAVRYEGENGEPDLELINYLPSDDNTEEPVYAMLTTLYQWHIYDPVSTWEENRNNIIYSDYQHNRNPFIDHPEWAYDIWQQEINITNNNFYTAIYPIPTSDLVIIESNINTPAKINVYNKLGIILHSNENVSFPLELNLSDINSCLVFVEIIQDNRIIRKKIIVK